MADDVVKRLLIKLGIDGADAVQFIARLQSQLDSLYQKSQAQAAKQKTAQQDDLAAMARQMDLAKQQTTISEQQVSNLRKQIEAKQVTVKQIQEEISKERAALDIRQATLRIMQAQGQMSTEVAKGLEKQISLERQKLALQQAQLRATGLSASAQKEQGAIGGAIATGARSLFGGGLIGGVAGGLIGGMAAVEGIQLLMESVRKLGEALMEASGPAQTLRLEFEKLATNKGNDPAELLQKMRVATHGMAADAALFQVANVTLRSNMKLTTDQMVKMLGMTVDLARLNGKDVPQALNAFTRSMETGQPFILARVLGLTNLQRGMQQLPRGIDPAVAATVRMNQVYMAMENALSKGVKPVLLTLPDLFVQVEAAEKNFVDGVAEGVFHTGSFSKNIQAMSKALTDAMPKIVEVGKAVGEGLAAAVKWLIDHWPELKTGFEVLVAIKLADWALSGTAAVWKLVEALGALNVAKAAGALGNLGLPGLGRTAESAGGGLVGLVNSIIPIAVPAVLAYMAGTFIGTAMNENARSTVRAKDQSRVITGYSRGVPIYGGAERRTPVYTDQELTQQAIESGAAVARPPITGKGAAGGAGGIVGTNKFVDIESQKKNAVEMANIRKEQAKLELEYAQQETDAEQEILKTKYQIGLTQLDDYLAQEKAIRHKQMEDRDTEIRKEAEAQKDILKVSIQPTRTPEGIEVQPSAQAIQLEKTKEAMVDKETEVKIQKNHEDTRMKDVDGELKSLDDKKAANQAYQQELIKMQRESMAEQTALVEKQFKQGNLGPEQYIAQRRAMIEQENELVQDDLKQQLKDTTKTEKQIADIKIKGIEEALAAQKKLTDLETQHDQIRVQALENSYSGIKSGLGAQQAAAQLSVQQRQPGARADETAILEQQIAANDKYIQQLIQEASTLHSQPQLWAQVVDKIKQATEEQIKMNQQLRQARDFAKPLAGIFGAIAGAFGASRGGQQIAAVASSMQTSMEQLSQFFEAGGFSARKKAPKVGAPGAGTSPVAKASQDYSAAVSAATLEVKKLSDQEASTRETASKKLVDDLATLSQAFLAAAQKFIGPPRAPEEGAPAMPNMPVGAGPDLGPVSTTMPVLVTSASTTSGRASPSGTGNDSFSKITSKLATFEKEITSVIASLGNFIGALESAKSAAGGALSGGMSGMSTGGQIGNMIVPGMGGIVGSVVGGVGGAVMGGIMGQKQAEVQHDVKLIQAQLQNIIDQLQDGTISIAQAIANLRAGATSRNPIVVWH